MPLVPQKRTLSFSKNLCVQDTHVCGNNVQEIEFFSTQKENSEEVSNSKRSQNLCAYIYVAITRRISQTMETLEYMSSAASTLPTVYRRPSPALKKLLDSSTFGSQPLDPLATHEIPSLPVLLLFSCSPAVSNPILMIMTRSMHFMDRSHLSACGFSHVHQKVRCM